MSNKILKECAKNCFIDILQILLILFISFIILFAIPFTLSSNVSCEGSLSNCFNHKNYNYNRDFGYGFGFFIMYLIILLNIHWITEGQLILISIIKNINLPRNYTVCCFCYLPCSFNEAYDLLLVTSREKFGFIISISIWLLLIYIPGTCLGLFLSTIGEDMRQWISYDNHSRYGTHYINEITFIAPGLILANITVVILWNIFYLIVLWTRENYNSARKEIENQPKSVKSIPNPVRYYSSSIPVAKEEEIPIADIC